MSSTPRPIIGCMTRPFVARGASFEEALEHIANAGFRYLHFNPGDHRSDGTPAVPQDAGPAHLSALGAFCADHGLTPTSMFPRLGGELTAETLATFRTDVDTAAVLGIGTLIMRGPWPYRQALAVRRPRADVLASYDEWFGTMPALAAHAATRGVTLALKPHTGLTATSWELHETLARLNSPAVRACYDGGNVHYYEGLAPEEDVKEIAAATAALCVKDHRGPRGHDDFPTPGEGEVDHRSIIKTLRAAGFSGPCLVEMVGGRTPAETRDEASRGHSSGARPRRWTTADGAVPVLSLAHGSRLTAAPSRRRSIVPFSYARPGAWCMLGHAHRRRPSGSRLECAAVES